MQRTPPRRSPRLTHETTTSGTTALPSMNKTGQSIATKESVTSTPCTSGAASIIGTSVATVANTPTTTTVTITQVSSEPNHTSSKIATSTSPEPATTNVPIATDAAISGNMEAATVSHVNSIATQQVSFLLEKLNSLESQLRDTQVQLRESNNQRAAFEEALRHSGTFAMPTSSSAGSRPQSSDAAVHLTAQNGTRNATHIDIPDLSGSILQNGAIPYSSLSNAFANLQRIPPISSLAPISHYANHFIPTSSGVTTTACQNSVFNGFPPTQLPSMPASFLMPRKVQELPEFSGCPEDWPLFSNVFYQSTSAYGYTNLENNQRLLKSLKGEAREVVKSLLIHPDSVSAVMEQLKIRFGRPELLIRSQLRQIKEIAPISESAIDKLIPFASKTKNLATFLQSVNGFQHLANPTLLDELIGKLPMSKKMDWAKYASTIKPYPTVADFSNWLTEVANLVCTLQDCEGRRRVVLHAVENKNKDMKATANCVICGGQHKVYTCKNFLASNVTERWAEVKRKRLCFSCLRNGHSSRDCRGRIICLAEGCQRWHHKLLHEYKRNTIAVPTQPAKSTESEPNNSQPVLNCTLASSKSAQLLFRVVPVTLYGQGRHVDTFAMLDEGSSITMIDKDVINELGIGGEQRELNVQWFGGRTTQELASLVNLKVSGKGMNKKHNLSRVYAVSNLSLPTQSLSSCDIAKLNQNICIMPQPYMNATPKLLIGLDNCHLGLPSETIKLSHQGPFAANTELGWVVFGPIDKNSSPMAMCLHVGEVNNHRLHDLMQRYFDIENFGVRAAPPVRGETDIRAESILKATVKQVSGRYQAGLLWKSDHIQLPDSYEMAKRRLLGIERKMTKDTGFANAYKNVMQKYIDSDYVRRVMHSEVNLPHPRLWYLPHFAVVNPNKPGKIRLVFDAAADVDGVSLNSCLLKGPQDYQLMANILFNFRMGAVAVCGDIKEMFHQVLVRPEDRCSQRFLWRFDDKQEPDVYEMQVMTFGAACSPCIAQYVKTFNALQYSETFSRAVEAIVKHHYVDDFVDSFVSVEEAIQVAKQVREIHRKAGFQMRGFISNSSDVANTLRENGDDAMGSTHFGGSNLVAEKVLGMFWQPQDDAFRYELKFPRVDKEVIQGHRSPTKRELLSYVMSIFDPLGFLCHLTVGAKLFLREVWRRKIGWDTPLPADIQNSWKRWQADVKKAAEVRIGRHYFPGYDGKNLQLHTFVDASEGAYAAVCYWRYTTSHGIGTALVCAKTKCAPTKPTTIPRLELQAAVLGTRMAQMVIQEHNVSVHSYVFWSDSSTVISWIKSSQRRYKPFVAHRVAEILASTEPKTWRWISTRDNVADEATRWTQDIHLAPSSRWFIGPALLRQEDHLWPQEIGEHNDFAATAEVISASSVLLTTNSDFINFDRFSSYMRLKRTTAWIYRFINRARRRSSKSQIFGLTSSELDSAEKLLCRQAQASVYSSEICRLGEKQMMPNDSTICDLLPFLDSDGVLRVGGRIEAASWLPFETIHPIIMPTKHRITTLIVSDYHQRMKHQNIEATIGEVRRKFWVVKLRQLLRQVIASCQICKIERAKPLTPIMAQLPADRLTPFIRPFTYTGLDYFGPLKVTIGRRTEKRWVALFTCLTIRAIHLEVAHDLSTDSCILTIRNFINRRGVPTRIRSDNGKNFVGADQVAKRFDDVFDCEKVQSELANKGVQWMFNCPNNPSEGGIWERMVRCVKRALYHMLKEKAPREQTLQSAIIEAENLVNSRPLTHITISPDQDEPLTPNHFLLGTANTAKTPALNEVEEKTCALRKQWRIARQLRQRFWKRWVLEYLPTLTRRVKWCARTKPLKEGDIVFICDADMSRRQWCRGVVERVYKGADGEVRRADVRTKTGILRRPTSKLAVLDVKYGESE